MKSEGLFGFYRGLVVDNKDPEFFGRVLTYIPVLMPTIEKTEGIWSRPANNSMGGRNVEEGEENYYQGTSFIPAIGSWIWLFFENGSIHRPYYFAALNLENAKVLPENQVGDNPSEKWVVFKSHDGRTIVLSDDPSDARVEITGKKRQISEPPSGDTNSVYSIDDNMNCVLLDERDGKEKILIRTYKGDFLNIDIENRKLHCSFDSDIHIKTKGSIFFEAVDDINLKAQGSLKMTSTDTMDIKSESDLNIQASGTLNEQAGGNINTDGALRYDQSGNSGPAGDAQAASPVGGRD